MELDLRQILHIIWRRKWVLLITLVIAISFAAYYSYQVLVPEYQASTKIFVNKTRVVEGETNITLNDLNTNIQLIQTYKELIRSEWITKDIMSKYPQFQLTSDQLLNQIQVSSINQTQVMVITAQDTSYQRAAELANAVTNVFITKVPNLIQMENVTVLSYADPTLSKSPIKPVPEINIIIASVLAFMIGLGIIFLMEYFDESIKTEEELEQLLGLTTIAVVHRVKRKDYKVSKNKLSNSSNSAPIGGNAHVQTSQQ